MRTPYATTFAFGVTNSAFPTWISSSPPFCQAPILFSSNTPPSQAEARHGCRQVCSPSSPSSIIPVCLHQPARDSLVGIPSGEKEPQPQLPWDPGPRTPALPEGCLSKPAPPSTSSCLLPPRLRGSFYNILLVSLLVNIYYSSTVPCFSRALKCLSLLVICTLFLKTKVLSSGRTGQGGLLLLWAKGHWKVITKVWYNIIFGVS